ncbi:hypothetical protein [Butyrivibrio sp. AE3006]|uniref:hypothetical protein n=1 Tax=Butyrivibrio sp. AE3006 TaxID=1280673 RepID=UPI0004131927|nr:hypothetical protein [Butyrivibrio sp. AE3006]
MSFVSNNDNFKSREKGISLIICAVLLLAVLLSSFFVAAELGHDCSGDECPICQMIAQSENFVNQIGTGLIILAAALLVVFSISEFHADSFRIFAVPTLVRQKVRLNN